jgi:hypothetical protein
MIFTQLADGKFKYEAVNFNLVKCLSCGGVMGDPYMGLVIKNGYFSVEHYGGSRERWSQTTTFKYDKLKLNWFLHRDSEEVIDALEENEKNNIIKSESKTTKDFGVIKFEDYKMEL